MNLPDRSLRGARATRPHQRRLAAALRHPGGRARRALDDAVEDAVLPAIEALGPELAIILITHRLRPLRAMAAVWRVEGGGVVLAQWATDK